MAHPKPFATKMSAARRAVVLRVVLASAVAVIGVGNAAASLGFDIPDEFSDKRNKIDVEGTTNFKRFNEVDSPLSQLVLAHVALGRAQ